MPGVIFPLCNWVKQAWFPGFAAASLEEEERINFLFPKVGTDWISPINVKRQISGLREMKKGNKGKISKKTPKLSGPEPSTKSWDRLLINLSARSCQGSRRRDEETQGWWVTRRKTGSTFISGNSVSSTTFRFLSLSDVSTNLGHKSLWSCCPSRSLRCSPIGGAVSRLLLWRGHLFRETVCTEAGGLTPGGPCRSIRADTYTQRTAWVMMATFLLQSSAHPIKLERGEAASAHVRADLVGVCRCLAFKVL